MNKPSIATEAKTLTEKELWYEFAQSSRTIKKKVETSFGCYLEIKMYKISDHLIDCGEYGATEKLSEEIATSLALSESPESDLHAIIEDIQSYLGNLKKIADDFAATKQMHLVDDDEADQPRFHCALSHVALTQPATDTPNVRQMAEGLMNPFIRMGEKGFV